MKGKEIQSEVCAAWLSPMSVSEAKFKPETIAEMQNPSELVEALQH